MVWRRIKTYAGIKDSFIPVKAPPIDLSGGFTYQLIDERTYQWTSNAWNRKDSTYTCEKEGPILKPGHLSLESDTVSGLNNARTLATHAMTEIIMLHSSALALKLVHQVRLELAQNHHIPQLHDREWGLQSREPASEDEFEPGRDTECTYNSTQQTADFEHENHPEKDKFSR